MDVRNAVLATLAEPWAAGAAGGPDAGRTVPPGGTAGPAPAAAVPVGALGRVLEPLGVQPAAVRTAVARMVRAGQLVSAAGTGSAAAPLYLLSTAARRRAAAAARRAARADAPQWDGAWRVLVVGPAATRAARDRLADALTVAGFGLVAGSTQLAASAATWVAVSDDAVRDAEEALAAAGVRADRFVGRLDGDAAALVVRAFDVDGLARRYLRFLDTAQDALSALDGTDPGAFAALLPLRVAWRELRATDPALPPAVLPADWPAAKVVAVMREAERWAPAAARHVSRCLRAGGSG